jgi:arylsulfatase A-like enzyme
MTQGGISRRGFVSMAGLAAAAPMRPNIIFIMADDHPNSALSCYGSEVIRTPHLDRIAREGMRFDHAYVTTSLCSPSRATILTGKYPHVNGQVTIAKLFDGGQPTFPKALQKAGYQTAIVGKWHLTTEPTGFDSWNVLIGQGAYFNPVLVENGKLRKHSGYVTDVITDLALEWLENRAKDRPFCLLYHHKAPHWVWEPDAKHARMFAGSVFPEPETFNDTHQGRISPRESDLNVAELHSHPLYAAWPGRKLLPSRLTPAQIKQWNYQQFMRDVLGCVASVDENVGRLLAYLDRAGLAGNTVVIYTSDNGYFLGEHGWTDKKVIYEEAIRVPLLVRYPGQTPAASVNRDFVLNTDYAPTLMELAGARPYAGIQGRSIRPLLEGRTPADWRRSFYYQYYSPNQGIDRRLPHYGIRTRRHKLAYWYREINSWELYDLEKDPRELRNVYGERPYTGVVTELKRELSRLRAEVGITAEMEQSIAEQVLAGRWAQEVREYERERMGAWR